MTRASRWTGGVLIASSIVTMVLDVLLCFSIMTRTCGGLFIEIFVAGMIVGGIGLFTFVTSFLGDSPVRALRPPHVFYVFGPAIALLAVSDLMPWDVFRSHDLKEAATAAALVWPLIGYVIFVLQSRRAAH